MKILQIGRSQENDVVISDSSVSKIHAQLFIGKAGNATIIDLGSTNGTFVNGKRLLQPQELFPNDTVSLGNFSFPWRTYVAEIAKQTQKHDPASEMAEKPSHPAPNLPAHDASRGHEATMPPINITIQAPPRPRSGLRGLLIVMGILAVVAIGAFAILNYAGKSMSSMSNLADTLDLQVDCAQVDNVLLSSIVTVVVSNGGHRTHDNVTVSLKGYDAAGNFLIEKMVIFDWSLGPNAALPKLVSMPAKVRTCKCEVVDSNPR